MKKKTLHLLIVILSTGFLVSCKDQPKEENSQAVQSEQETSTKPAESEVKVNPAHGLAGHRCDLPVGAPLNGNNTSNQTQVDQLPSTSVSPIRVDQTPEVNPPHGEPGHDCSVPVGAKLR